MDLQHGLKVGTPDATPQPGRRLVEHLAASLIQARQVVGANLQVQGRQPISLSGTSNSSSSMV